jgi:quercetin dioxygenase-like cupin family protein
VTRRHPVPSPSPADQPDAPSRRTRPFRPPALAHGPKPVLLPLVKPPDFPAIKLNDLFNLVARQAEIAWEPFRPGVDLHRIYGDGNSGSSAVLIRFQPGARVPRHEHDGYEHILVLSGSQQDENGVAAAGTLIVNPPGTSHSIFSPRGCIVLAIYEKPVRFPPDK